MKERSIFLWIPVLISVCPFVRARADETAILTVDNEKIPFTRIEIETADPVPRAIVHKPSGEKATLSCDTIVEITFQAIKDRKEFAERDMWVQFSSGDKFLGTIQEKAVEGGIHLRTSAGVMDIKLEMLSSLLLPANQKSWPVEPPSVKESDVLATHTGDQIKGTVEEITYEKVIFDATALKAKVTKKLNEVSAVYFMSLGKPPKEPDHLIAIVLLDDGSMVRGKLESAKDGVLKLKTLYAQDLLIPMASISTVYFKNGRVVYASDLDPVKVDEQPNYIRTEKPHPSDLSFPYQKDLSVKQTKLSLKGTQYRKGIGVHSRSALTFRIDGKFSTFAATVGLDDLARSCPNNLGSVTFEVLADGKKVFESGLVRTTDSPKDISISVQGMRELTLLVDFGEDGSVCDYADWAGARFIR